MPLALALVLFAALVTGIRSCDAAPPGAATYEAETGKLSGVEVAASTPGYSGTGYVTWFDTSTDSLTVTVPSDQARLVDLALRYRAPYGTKYTRLSFNGGVIGEVALPETTVFGEAPAGRVLLSPGDNTITLLDDWGWYDIDAVVVTPAPPRPQHQVTGALVNPGASPEAKALARYLAGHYGANLLAGQQDRPGIDWIGTNVGRLPAIAGFDLMDYSPSRVEHGAASKQTEAALDWAAKGGIVTLCWHWNAPAHLVDQPGKEWYKGFDADATTFDVAAALADPDSPEYTLLLRDIDAIAAQLTRLRDAHVPVLWRPLHEAEGGWFWWGAKGPGPAKALWRLLYDRMTRVHRLDNLIWVWSSPAPDWYPGDDVVDVLGVDAYPPVGDHGALADLYDRLVAIGQDRKLVALTEVGSLPDPDLVRAWQADWAYFVTWPGYESDERSNPLALVRKLYADPRVVTLDELGGAGTGRG